MDIMVGFLSGDPEEKIYIDQFEGYACPSKKNIICELIKPLYELKQTLAMTRVVYHSLI